MLKIFGALLIFFVSFEPIWGHIYATELKPGNPYNVPIDFKPFVQIRDGFYFFGTEQVNWYVAHEKCRKMEADLVTFETPEEFDAISAHLKSKGVKSEHWTSGNDLGKTGTHNWFSNSQPINIQRWAPKQPDNAGGKEHCIHLGYVYKTSTLFQLNDRPCSDDKNSLFNYICEAAKPETITIVFKK
ncbi:uncharacterized protein Dana_GF27918 [Drosophila ananassae]|uniref:C-type lectin domain-containing protein n=1 Tax=Drosophila ananassae TaxID=7217 RepID=A0A0P8Y4N5_DROAN|nr:C-type lectin 37Da [Drosophila ananassae]KPU73953.1 uncharacterized protein Dana_GF27918 [Drosophila ananassae]